MIRVGDPIRRARFLSSDQEVRHGPILYWMSRDQRAEDNWALLYAQAQALARGVPLLAAFTLEPSFSAATERSWDFLLRGLQEVEATLQHLHVPFHLLIGSPAPTMIHFAEKYKIGMIVTDFSPLRHKRAWMYEIGEASRAPLVEVDAHNLVPAWIASARQEYAARTFRPKLSRLLPEYLEDFPELVAMPRTTKPPDPIDWTAVRKTIPMDGTVPAISWLIPGQKAARAALSGFLKGNLRVYAETRNQPTIEGTSNLSPYLHFGHLSAQRVALATRGAEISDESRAAFLEELIVRRELSDNFCLYNLSYDNPEGYPRWATQTLTLHQGDPRPYLYQLPDFEQARTHDDLWNAAQRQMVSTGKMHGYLRMYWAKKILEWTGSGQEAHQIALKLNDKYELDGRDPNGYVGISWSLGGVHDRPWGVRPIFGSIRFMSIGGCRSKFKVAEFISRWRP